ncbi:MAG: adenosylmethionine decarboxylase [Candidatus Bathyarchaeota archaeon]|jgi:S-adenosylmethionine decarboxylase proenzyme
MPEIRQLLVDLYNCEADLDDEGLLTGALERAAERAGSTVVNTFIQRFAPVGVSVFLVLAETHLSIHTWPEHRYAALDIFVCGEGKDPGGAWDSIREDLKPRSYEIREFTRDIGGEEERRPE